MKRQIALMVLVLSFHASGLSQTTEFKYQGNLEISVQVIPE